MADNDYICVYRQFFEEFAKTFEMEDSRPMRINVYDLSIDELVGEVMQSCVNYLVERKCPRSLVVPLTKIVVEEFINEAKKQPEEVNNPLKLNRKTHEKISEVCLRYTDNEKLSNLPGPVQETYYSTHSTKHTRRRMEDRLICLPRFNTLHGVQSNSEAGYYGIFDGHSGVNAACYAVSHLHQFLAESECYPDDPVQAFRQAFEKTEFKYNAKSRDVSKFINIMYNTWVITPSHINTYLRRFVHHNSDGHRQAESFWRNWSFSMGVVSYEGLIYIVGGCTHSRRHLQDDNSGTTVLAILHQPVEKKLTVAWVGDSLAMLVNEDSYVMLIDPHKPERPDERRRVEALGGCVIRAQSVYRVNGGLAISRAIGDKKLKPFVSAEPEIRVLDLTGSEHFIVMGCDGLWDVVEPREVIETVYFEVKKHGGQIDSVAKRLVDLAKENNSTDNISVIVIFLTDPAEISNRSVDVTGHRPKILHQDGVIMEANFQPNDKSPFGDPGMNGIYETNGNHFNVQNESDEDFGPETDVDAVDDVVTSPKSLNPFAKDCWQKTTEESSEKLIEFTRQESKNIEDEILKFSEGFAEPPKPADEKISSQVISDEVKSDSFPVDNSNPFTTSVTNNASNTLDNFVDDNNKYLDEIYSRKEEADNFMSSNVVEQSFDSKNDEKILEKPQDQSRDLFCFDGNGFTDPEQTPSCTSPQDTNFFVVEDSVPKVEEEEAVEKLPLEPPVEKEFVNDSHVNESPLLETLDSHSNEINATPNKTDEIREDVPKTNEGTMDLMVKGVPLHITDNPPELCSVVDTVEAEKALPATDESIANKEGEEPSSELLSPSAPMLDGEPKDETVAESGGEIDSEDDEWNYIKVESGVHQAVPIDSKPSSNLGPSVSELSEFEKPTMNSPLNPEADEFVPVSAMTSTTDLERKMTPKKAIPQELTDIIASSPNWNNMNNVSLPEESAFLNEIKSRPSNIFKNVASPQQEELGEMINVLNNSLNLFASGEPNNKENEVEVDLAPAEPRGLDLAGDMTSSFIDPATMSSDIEAPKEKVDLLNFQEEQPVIEAEELICNESASKGEIQELAIVEVASQSTILLSPLPVEEDFSPVSPVLEKVESSPVEAPVISTEPIALEMPQPLIPEVQEESKPVEKNEATEPTGNDQLVTKPQELLETKETPKPEDVAIIAAAATAVAATAAAATAVGVTAAKKDVKKTAAKTASTNTTRTSTKPLANGTKTSAATKRPTTSTGKTPATGKATGTTFGSASKTATSRLSNATKTQTKSATSAPSTANKAPARSRPSSVAPKSSPTTKTTAVTTSPAKTTTTTTNSTLKPATKTPTTVSTLKAKPRVSSALVDKKTTTALNGDVVKSSVKRTEITKKVGGTTLTCTTTTTTTTTTTRVSLSSRPATAPAKSTTVRATQTTSRMITAKPRTAISSNHGTHTVTAASKTTPTARKLTVGSDKQAKEAANRLTSKTTSASKTNGVTQKSTTATAKPRKTLTSTTTPTKVKNNKTETKAEKILEEKVENEAPLINNTSDINLINSMASE